MGATQGSAVLIEAVLGSRASVRRAQGAQRVIPGAWIIRWPTFWIHMKAKGLGYTYTNLGLVWSSFDIYSPRLKIIGQFRLMSKNLEFV